MVPRGVKKQELHSSGLVVNFVDFWTGYSEEDVRWTIEASITWQLLKCLTVVIANISEHHHFFVGGSVLVWKTEQTVDAIS